ncbi:MAG: hypothetical protein IPP71_17520 [Bacteroidetes bacterium]|nr:hypothetical protein [Bacteroidota bacterium]
MLKSTTSQNSTNVPAPSIVPLSQAFRGSSLNGTAANRRKNKPSPFGASAKQVQLIMEL